MNRILLSASLATLSGSIFAQQGTTKLTAFPAMSVADGRSTSTITAEVRLSSGRPVADGTRVVFATTIGYFRESIATTSNGLARAVLVSSPSPGTAKITASALTGEAAPSTLEFEFVADRAALSTAREYIEIVASGYMQYTPDTRLMAASGINGGVSIRYRDVSITADDIQLNTQTYELRARKAKFKLGSEVKVFDELYIRLNQRRGYGTTTFEAPRPETLSFTSKSITGLNEDGEGKYKIAEPELRYGLVEIQRDRLVPLPSRAMARFFDFEDLGNSPSTVMAKKAVVFPMRQIQFQQADIVVANRSVMKIPLFQVNLQQSSSPMVMDQIVNVNDSKIQVNYPYYLTLKPGQTSLFRLRTGESYGRGVSGNSGAFLDYEFNWNRGDDLDGGVALQGIGRDDWGLSFRQYQRIDDRSTAFAQLDLPRGSSILGSASIGRQFNGFQANFNANMTRSLRGLDYNSQDVSFVVEKDPIKVGQLPLKLYTGFTASNNYNSLVGRSQSTAGLRLRGITNPLQLAKGTNVTSSFSISALSGGNTTNGLSYAANLGLSQQVNKSLTMMVSYDFTKDGYNDSVVGMHRLSLQGYFSRGRISANMFMSRSLDVDRQNIFGDLSYGFSRQWRFGYQYTFDRISGTEFLDYNYVIGYRLGWREVGIVWSRLTNRFGIQLTGASLN